MRIGTVHGRHGAECLRQLHGRQGSVGRRLVGLFQLHRRHVFRFGHGVCKLQRRYLFRSQRSIHVRDLSAQDERYLEWINFVCVHPRLRGCELYVVSAGSVRRGRVLRELHTGSFLERSGGDIVHLLCRQHVRLVHRTHDLHALSSGTRQSDHGGELERDVCATTMHAEPLQERWRVLGGQPRAGGLRLSGTVFGSFLRGRTTSGV